MPNPYLWLLRRRMDDKTMIIAEYKDQIIAQSENSIEIENSIYFPRSDVFMSFLTPTTTVTRCPWKGMATYFEFFLLYSLFGIVEEFDEEQLMIHLMEYLIDIIFQDNGSMFL